MGAINLLLLAGVIGLVLAFGSSSKLASAYGIAVTGTMVVTAMLAFVVAQRHWHWPLWAAVALISPFLLIDLVFSIDSIITAVGMTSHVPIMVIAVLVAVAVMLLAATPLANFIQANPTVVMLALGFLLLIGTMLIAEGFGAQVPKGYVYGAMAFSALVESLNILARRNRQKRSSG